MSVSICIECKKPVGKRQQARQCDGCDEWQHRTCNTSVSQPRYRDAVKTGDGINWRCGGGSISNISQLVPVAESTRKDNQASLVSFVHLTPPGPSILENYSTDFVSFEVPPSLEEESMEDAVPNTSYYSV